MEAFQLALEAAQLIIKLLTVKPGQQLFSKAQNSIGKPAAEGKQQQHQNHERLGEKAEHRKGPHNPA